MILLEKLFLWELIATKEDKAKEPWKIDVPEGCFIFGDMGVKYLRKNPEVFPNKIMREAFERDTNLIYESLEAMVMTSVEIDEDCENFQASFAGDQLVPGIWLPSQDKQRKPWQQFLHNKAPGTGIRWPFIRPLGSTQAFPLAGCRIVRAMNEELQQIYKGLESVS